VKVKALVLKAAGTNCDGETAHALKISGAQVDTLHLNEILKDQSLLYNYSILVVPGGFSYGDDIAAGKILANELKFKLGVSLRKFVAEKRLVLGICNGFQVLTKAGLLPQESNFEQSATLVQNVSGRFQCEWVALKKEKSKAHWLDGLPNNFELPIAHGEGYFVTKDKKTLNEIEKKGQVVFRYSPKNPNGSLRAIAGICNESGNVLGLMPHPERFVSQFQHPEWSRKEFVGDTPGLLFWKSAVQYAKGI